VSFRPQNWGNEQDQRKSSAKEDMLERLGGGPGLEVGGAWAGQRSSRSLCVTPLSAILH
jgi:hypothetical protein